MGNIFSASEIVQIGVQIEINGKEFYDAVAKKSKDKDAGKIFEYLAGEEKKHIGVFSGLLSSIEKYEPAESYPGEYFAYLKALADQHVFTKEKKGAVVAGRVKTDLEAVETGINAEKDSILFYNEMKKFVPQGQFGVIDKIINEEKEHLRKLAGIKLVILGDSKSSQN